MSRPISNVVLTTDTFGSWITRTNDIIAVISNSAVTTAANTGGDLTTGNGFVIGIFGSNTITTSSLRGGNVTSSGVLTISSNTNIGNSTVAVETNHNNVVHTKATSYTTTNTDLQTIDSFSTTVYRGGKYILTLRNTDNNDYQITEIMLLHDSANTYSTEYATLISNTTLGQFSSDISGGSLRLRVTPTSANNLIKYQRTLLTVS